ncbi:MAG: endonuclease/exonuclease/phosphatase family protein [Planctomycetota bacterium]
MAALLLLFLVFQAPASSPKEAPQAGPLRIVTWNLDNFFDSFDDPWRRDEKTRPPSISGSRQERVAAVLHSLDADVVCLQEVENRFFLERFVRERLGPEGYEVVLLEGNDGRGIDVALLSRFPVGAVTSYRHLRFSDAEGHEHRFQRDLLRVHLGPPLDAEVFVVHFRSQLGGEESDQIRLAEARAAAGVFQELHRENPRYRAILAGDLNDRPDSPTLAVLRKAGLIDACADSTVPSYNRKPYRSRIDYFLLSPALARRRPDCKVLETKATQAASDHNPVLLFLPRTP